jgi:hypothetical protein
MRALLLFAAAGCVTAIRPRGGELATTAAPFTLRSQAGESEQSEQSVQWALGDALAQGHVVLVFYRGHW